MKRIFIYALLSMTCLSIQAKQWTKGEVANIISRVNNTWQMSHPDQERSFWDPAVYHTGNMEACLLFKNQKWFDYSKACGEKNLWQGAREADNSRWLYKQYGESMQHVLFGDWQICFQTFIDLYNAANDFNETGDVSRWVARAKEVMSYEAYSDANDYWWWADALYMVMPVMTKMYKLTGDTKYLDKMYENWEYSNSIMYDQETGLYFRDGKYVYPKHKTAAGKKDFWARGDGWVLAEFAKILKDLPKKD
ncbi:MAG: glycoside hydrolase family 88 protein, partial [Prevotella sp.]|nr:glycoside hydrolase family 88 protein [Prevotella sp.]